MDEKEVRRRLTALRRRSQGRITNLPIATEAGFRYPIRPNCRKLSIQTQREFLELLMTHPECLPFRARANLTDYLGKGISRKIYDACCRLADEGMDSTFDRLMLEFDEPADKNPARRSRRNEPMEGAANKRYAGLLRELINTFKRKESEKQRPRANHGPARRRTG